MSNAHRSTDWRCRRTNVVRNDLGIKCFEYFSFKVLAWLSATAFSQAATRQAVDIIQPIVDAEVNMDTDYHSTDDMSNNSDEDQDMESPVESNLEPNKEDDLTQSI